MLGASVLVLAGPPCAGKSTVGRLVAKQQPDQAVSFVQVDTLFDLLLPESDRGRDDRSLAYEAAHSLVGTLLQHDRSCVLECTYARRDQRASLSRALAGFAAPPLHLVELTVTTDDALARFGSRHDATDLDEVSLRERVENYPYWTGAHQLQSGSGTPETLAQRIVSLMARSALAVDARDWTNAGRAWT
jgi:predicted kinase